MNKRILSVFTIAFILLFSFAAQAEIKGHKKIDGKYISTKTGFEDCQVEVGNLQSATFRPHLKIKKWDNEASFDIELISYEQDLPTGQAGAQVVEDEVNGKIKWVGQKKEAHFYELPSDNTGKFENGGYEFEVVLKEKPISNVMRFTIQTKNLAFFYQPPLTADEIARGASMPDDAIGSYAVYHSTKNNNQYKTGKAFHIYRPKIFDSSGKWTWGELNIDMSAGLLTVTIPQQFLDTAVYPVYHAAGLTFGYTSVGIYTWNGYYLFAYKATMGSNAGTANAITLYAQSNNLGMWHGAIYDHTPNNLIANSITDNTNIPDSTAAWRTANTGAASLDANTVYYIAFQFSEYLGKFYYDWDSSYPFIDRVYAYNSFPSTFGTATSQGMRTSIYVTYTEAVSAKTVMPSAGSGGTISPNTPQTVNYNSTTSFTITPNTGYSIASVSGCGGTLSGSMYTTGLVTVDCTVSASFAINTSGTEAEKIIVQDDQGTTRFSVTSGGQVRNLYGGFVPSVLADSDASNNLVYYSTTQGKLVYKDSTGVVHALY